MSFNVFFNFFMASLSSPGLTKEFQSQKEQRAPAENDIESRLGFEETSLKTKTSVLDISQSGETVSSSMRRTGESETGIRRLSDWSRVPEEPSNNPFLMGNEESLNIFPSAFTTEKMGFCKRCNSFKFYRAHHCKICDKCVIKMDHHCRIL